MADYAYKFRVNVLANDIACRKLVSVDRDYTYVREDPAKSNINDCVNQETGKKTRSRQVQIYCGKNIDTTYSIF